VTRVVARPPTIEEVTRRIWVMLAAGAVLVAAAGGTALATGGSSAALGPAGPSWNLYPPADWDALAARSGLRRATVRIVAATVGRQRRPFALLAGERRGRTCFVLAQGRALGAPLCRLERPLTLFAMRDRRQGRRMTDVLGLARHDVVSVASTSENDGRPITSGQPLTAVPGGFAFGSGTAGSALTLVARNASGAVLARLRVAP
jgi:hypothetical protein